ncbi:MAG TPA: hypothetical protein VMV81_11650, partial [Phycisphaerae bacterium]|nr:hypothetical protein [Phycisphaerae bacterium]
GPEQPIGVSVDRAEDPAIYSKSSGRVSLSAAVGETVGFQLVLRAAASALTGIELATEDVSPRENPSAEPVPTSSPAARPSPGSTAGFAVRLFRILPVQVDRFPNWTLRSIGSPAEREIFDALAPLNAPRLGQPYSVVMGNPLPIWVELKIPVFAEAGQYQTAVVINVPRLAPIRIPIDVRVRDLLVSPDRGASVFARVDLGPIIAAHGSADPRNFRTALKDPEIRAAIMAAFRLLHDHGLSPYCDQIKPLFSQDLDGKLKIDWSEYDDFCGPLIDGRAFDDRRAARGWPLPIDLEQPDPVQYDGMESPAYATVFADYLAAVRSHFAERNWLGGAWIHMGIAPGPVPSARELAGLQRVSSWVHRRSIAGSQPASSQPDVAGGLLSTLIPQSMRPFGWIDYPDQNVGDQVDIWNTAMRYFHRPTMQLQKMMGKRVWGSPDQPPFGSSLSIAAPRSCPRSMGWELFLSGCDAIHLSRCSDWPANCFESPLMAADTVDDAWLVYPGAGLGLSEPIASVRLKLLQMGLQDQQLLNTLVAQGRSETAKLLAGSLIKDLGLAACGDNFQDPLYERRVLDVSAWRKARELLLEEAASAASPRADEALDKTGNRARWSSFLASTRRIRLQSEGTRVTAVHVPSSEGGVVQSQRILTVTHQLELRNELRTTLQGSLMLESLPPGAQATAERIAIGPLAEYEVLRQDVSWRFRGLLPCDLDGHYGQKIRLESEASDCQVDAVLSAVEAPFPSRPITIDGQLNDWVPSEFNSAGDFRLVSTVSFEGRSGTTGRPKPKSPTVAYFCRDRSNLYICIHAAAPEHSGAERVTSNIDYQDLAPVGQDLVEILLDPTNQGTRCEDLYHVVIGANGLGVFEKGVAVRPAIGRVQPWPGATPRYAVVRTDYGWCAELAIPIEPLAGGNRLSVWGLNIARVEPVSGEYSDWARAPRYCYNPRTLGNLIWPE